jgi:lipopolysaccharide heptosyltransferase III
MNFNRILIIQLKHLGDILLLTPVIAALKEAWPWAAVSALVPRGMEAMLTEHPGLTEVLTIDRRDRSVWNFLTLARELRRIRFDLVLEFSGGDRGALCAWLSGARTRISFDYPRRPGWHRLFAFTSLVPPPPLRNHIIVKNLALVRSLEIETGSPSLQFFWNAQTSREIQDLMQLHNLTAKNFVVMHPPARWLFKCWTAEGYARVIDAVQQEYGLPVVLTAAPAPQEMQFMQDISARLQTNPVNLTGSLDLKALGALIAQARLFIGVDSAPMHLAAAVGTPTVVLFGPSGPYNWRPWGEGHMVLTKNFDCQPCGRDGCDGTKISRCLTAITPAEVLAAVDRQLQACA